MIGPNGAAGNIYVVYLKNADAAKLAVVLRVAMTSAPPLAPCAARPA
jgi:general secretion pathway protein D